MNSDKSARHKVWPTHPYKGLSYYEAEDRAIFAGREQDLLKLSRLLSNFSNRIIVLHGRTGCGKSSFLRASVIPFLEREEHGFQFIKKNTGEFQKALFVRSTDCPLTSVADVLFNFISQGFQITTPVGDKHLNLTAALLGYTTLKAFIENVGRSSALTVDVLMKLSGLLPRTFVLVIDQAEEVLTIKPGKQGDHARSEFFQFLASLSATEIDLKLLIAVRTEYFGIFRDEYRQFEPDESRIDDYLLKELDEENLIRAVTRPTSLDAYHSFGCPRDQYHFYYESGLPETIVSDLKKLTPEGGVLPATQIVCDRLYNSTKSIAIPGSTWIIRKKDYSQLGGIQGQITTYLNDVLKAFCRRHLINPSEIELEISRWKSVLLMLFKIQVDGTVTTELRTEESLSDSALKNGCILDFKKMLAHLSDDRQRIVRKAEIPNNETGRTVTCYSLGHDAIGLALKGYTPPNVLARPTPKVFMCYGRDDIVLARRLYSDLQREGIEAWLDTEKLHPGQHWKLEITRAMKSCSHFLVLLSNNSISKSGYLQNELRIALELYEESLQAGHSIIPVRLEDCKVPQRKLNEIHWVDLFPSYDKGFSKILKALLPLRLSKKSFISHTMSKIADFDPSKYIERKLQRGQIRSQLSILSGHTSIGIRDAIEKNSRIALIADAGSGKTTLLRMIAWYFSNEDTSFYPILIYMNKYRETYPLVSLFPTTWTEIPEKNLLILLDGIDEVPPQHIRGALNDIEWLAAKYPNSHIVVSCRSNFYQLELSQSATFRTGFTAFTIDDLNHMEISEYIERNLHRWKDDFYRAIESNDLRDLLRSPFYLISLVDIFKNSALLPGTKYEIFERLVLDHRQFALDWSSSNQSDTEKSRIIHTLECIAVSMESLCRNYITQEELAKIVQDEFSMQLISHCRLWSTEKLQFQHNSIQEYLAARALSKQPVEVIRQFVSLGPDFKRIIPSCKNTIGFLLSISDRRDLLEWILQGEPEVVIVAEPNGIDKSKRIDVFKDIFHRHSSRRIWIDANKYRIAPLAHFGECEETIDFLLAEAESASHYTVLGNAINLLSQMVIPAFYEDRFQSVLLITSLNDDLPAVVRKDALFALSSLNLKSRQIVDQIIRQLRDSDNDWLRYGLYYFLNTTDFINDYIDIFLEGIAYLRNVVDTSSTVGRIRLGNESFELRAGLANAIFPRSVKMILAYFKENATDLSILFHDTKDLSFIFRNATLAYLSDTSILDDVIAFYFAALEAGVDVEADPVVAFFDETHNRHIAFRRIISMKHFGKSELLAILADEDCLHIFLEMYMSGAISDDEAWSFQHRLKGIDINVFNIFNKMINKASNNRFILSHHSDYIEEQRNRIKSDLGIMFDKKIFIDEINSIFEILCSREIQREDLVKVRNKMGKSSLIIQILNKMLKDAQALSLEHVIEQVDKWDWDSFCISKVYEYLNRFEDFILSAKQKQWIAEWCYSRVQSIDFKTAITMKDDNHRSVRKDAIYLHFFLIRLDLEYPKSVLLDMLSFDWNRTGIDYLEQRLDSDELTARVLQNLERGIVIDDVLENHLNYCRKHHIMEGVEFAIREIVNAERKSSRGLRAIALATVYELSDSMSVLEKALAEVVDEFKWRIVDVLVKENNEFVYSYLTDQFLRNSGTEKLKACEYLIKLQDVNALKYYVEEVKSSGNYSNVPFDITVLQSMRTLDSLPFLLELLEVSYSDNSKQDDLFERLDNAVMNSLASIALDSELNFITVRNELESFIRIYTPVHENVNWLYAFIDQLEERYYVKRAEVRSLDDIVLLVHKFIRNRPGE